MVVIIIIAGIGIGLRGQVRDRLGPQEVHAEAAGPAGV